MQYILGIDLGTSSMKVALLEADTLSIVAVADAEYPIHHPQPNYAEQHPDEWWQATVQATRQTLQNISQPDVIAIGLSGQMHGFVCLSKQGEPIQPAIIWADGRSEQQVEDLMQLGQQSQSSLPGYPATGFAASSALWLKQHSPKILQETDKWCLPKDYLRFKLTNIVASEPSDVASTWLYDVLENDWAEDICAHCGLTPEQMPTVIPSSQVSGTLTQESAEALGLSAGIPVVGGSADLPAQALGYGIQDSKSMMITIGSGGQVFLPTETPKIEANKPYYVFNHNLADTWYIQTSILTAGLSLRWLRDFLGLQEHENAYAHLSSLAEQVNVGVDGLLFLPYLAGERNPNPDANAQGMIFGLKLKHQPQHVARAIMEGVGFAVREALSHMPTSAETYVLTGGITQSPVWCQIVTDILAHPLQAPTQESAWGCVGVGLLAGMGVGHLDISTYQYQIENTTYYPKSPDVYDDTYEQFVRLYQSMKTSN